MATRDTYGRIRRAAHTAVRTVTVKKILVLLFICCVIIFFAVSPEEQTLRIILEHRDAILAVVSDNRILSMVLFLLLYIALVAASFPGGAVLTVTAGILFGFAGGVAVALCGGVVGATLATLAVRHLFRESCERRFGDRAEKIRSLVERNYTVSILLLRLSPVFPFFLVNIAMGLTKIYPVKYILLSAVGMLPGTALFVYIGTRLTAAGEIRDIVSPEILVALTALGLIPMIGKYLFEKIRDGAWFRM